MPVSAEDLSKFKEILPDSAILSQDAPEYKANSLPWSVAFDKRPTVILCPSSEAQLQKLVPYLYGTDLDFAIRTSGCGSSSASDVILSMREFTKITADTSAETIEVGGGCDWTAVDNALIEQAPGYLAVGARCPYVGVVGSTVMGGLSWLSHEFGLGSDPLNFLDARIVLADGRCIWASDEPDLLWALRGGGGNFGVVTLVRLRLHPYRPTVWAGVIQYSDPEAALPAVSRAVAKFAARDDPKMATHVFIVDFSQNAYHGGALVPSLVLMPFDGHGEAHALSEDGFKWALDIPGAQVDCREMTMRDVSEIQRGGAATHGQTQNWMQAGLVSEIDEHFVERCWAWYRDIVTGEQSRKFAAGAFALLEIMQRGAMMRAGSPDATAWPHAALGRKHVLQQCLGSVVGPASGAAELERNERDAMDLLARSTAQMAGTPAQPAGDYLPNFKLPFHDSAATFGQNWERLRRIKGRYDARTRFDKGFLIPPL